MDNILLFLEETSHRLVFVSIVSLLAYLLIILCYTKIYPKKKIPYPLLVLGFSILPVISVLRPGSYESGDLTVNIAKLMSFYSNLTQGNIIPRWSGELNATYGYPSFIFAYPLPYYISSAFHFMGFSFLNSLKTLLLATFLLSGQLMYSFLKKHVSPKSALLGSIFYLFAPYHLIDMHFRVDIGEVTAIMLTPLTFLLIDKVYEKETFLWQFLLGLSLCLLVLSHQAVSLLAFSLILAYVIFVAKKGALVRHIKSILMGLSLSAYYWIPVLLESKFTQQVNWHVSQVNFPDITQYIYSNWMGGFLFQGPNGELSYVLGYSHWIIITIAIFFLVSKKAHKRLLFFFLAFLVYFFLMTNASGSIWDIFSILRKIEFPYRILSVLVFITSVLAAEVTEKIKSEFLSKLLILLTIITSILNWGNRKNLPQVNDHWVQNRLPLMTAQGEGLFPAAPIWASKEDVWQSTVPVSHIESYNQSTVILSEARLITSHRYVLSTRENDIVKENTYYFPGWTLEVNGKPQTIQYQNPDYPGIIYFPLKKGENIISLTFEDTPIRKYSFFASMTTLFISGVYLIFHRKKEIKINPYRPSLMDFK